MVYQCPFLLEVLAQNNNTFPFQQHLKMTCDLLPPPSHACLIPFEQFIEQHMIQLQDSISEHLHHHTISSMFFDGTFEAHHAQILSCYGPRASAWLTSSTSLPNLLIIFPNFLHNIWYMTWTTPSFNYRHPLMCVHTSHWLYGDWPLMFCSWQWTHIETHDAIRNTFATIGWNIGFHVGQKQLHALLSTTFNSFRQRIDIVFTKDGIHTLADIVIANPMQIDLLP